MIKEFIDKLRKIQEAGVDLPILMIIFFYFLLAMKIVITAGTKAQDFYGSLKF